MLVLVLRKSGCSSPRVGSSYEVLSIFDAECAWCDLPEVNEKYLFHDDIYKRVLEFDA